jgi:hypothetical protein
MKDLIDSGVIGEVKAIWCRHFVSYGGEPVSVTGIPIVASQPVCCCRKE